MTERALSGLPIVTERCVWRPSRESKASYALGGYRQAGQALEDYIWQRSVADSTNTVSRAWRLLSDILLRNPG